MLPFESIEEASMSLGRNLTFGETLWFNYTADKSDFYLYCHNTIFLIIFYSLVPLPMVMIELLRSNKFEIYKIQPKTTFTLTEMMECYRKVLITFVFAVGPLQLLSYPIIEVCIIHPCTVYFFLFYTNKMPILPLDNLPPQEVQKYFSY